MITFFGNKNSNSSRNDNNNNYSVNYRASNKTNTQTNHNNSGKLLSNNENMKIPYIFWSIRAFPSAIVSRWKYLHIYIYVHILLDILILYIQSQQSGGRVWWEPFERGWKFFFGCLNRHLNQVKTKKTEFLQLSVVRYVRKAERFRKVIFHYPCLLQQSA